MCKKYIKIFIISAFIAFCMPVIACAAPREDEIEVVEDNYLDSFIEYFNLEEIEFIPAEQEKDDSEPKEVVLSGVTKVSEVKVEDELEKLESHEEDNDINHFSYLYFNKGFEEKKKNDDDEKVDGSVISVVPTFSETKNISGTGEEGVSVGIIVFNEWTEEDRPDNITFQSEIQTIGPSKLFNETIEFTVGANYILIAVMKDDIPEYKIFALNRKEEETKKKLENIEIEFIIIDEDTEEEEKEQDTKDENLFEKPDDLLGEKLGEKIKAFKIISK